MEMTFHKEVKRKLINFATLFTISLVCFPSNLIAQNNNPVNSKQEVHFAWLPFLDGIYYQFVFVEPQSDATKVCKQIAAKKNKITQLPETRTSNISTGIQFYSSTTNTSSHFGQSLINLPNERNIGGIYANPNALSGPDVNLQIQTLTLEQDRELKIQRHSELGKNPNILHGPSAAISPISLSSEENRKLLLRMHPELGLIFSNRPIKRGVLCIPDAEEIIWQVMGEYLTERPPPSPPSDDDPPFLLEYTLDKFDI